MVRFIGLTGGIAAGKSTVSEILSGLGADIIDADKMGHEVYLPGTAAWKDVVAVFGEGILRPDKTVNRPKLAGIVFSDRDALERLNQIVHPRIYKKIRSEMVVRRQSTNEEVVVVDAALLIEADWVSLVDEVWVVVADPDTVIDRLCSKRGFTKEHALSRIRSQYTDTERRRYADVIIENNGAIADIRQRVCDEWRRIAKSLLTGKQRAPGGAC